ncbi:MAG: hypothetical protein AAF528_08155 [Cyanobacteria bacterium P01_C01_bin.121]
MGIGQRMTATKAPEPGLLFGEGAIFLWKGSAIALLLNRLRRSHVRLQESQLMS